MPSRTNNLSGAFLSWDALLNQQENIQIDMKAKIRKTGEIVDVIAFKSSEACPEKDWVRYVDSEGLDLIQELNALEDLEVIDKTEDKAVDWEQRRYEIAKEMMAAFLSNSSREVYEGAFKTQAEYAVVFADALIAELKEGGET